MISDSNGPIEAVDVAHMVLPLALAETAHARLYGIDASGFFHRMRDHGRRLDVLPIFGIA